MNLGGILGGNNQIVVFLILIWSIFWKGIALWRASQAQQRNWFIVILILSSLGIIEIIYLFRFAKKRLTIKEISSWVQR